MKKWIKISVLFFFGIALGFQANAQYGFSGPNRYYYEDEFDWRWDLRVRISEGHNMGYLSRRQANRLYKRLENIERKEWAFQADGYYSVWEQDEVWLDVVDLNRRLGIMLTDWDRYYYGYRGIAFTGSLRWYYGPSYDFYRFDKRGYGTIYIGYTPRYYYPVKNVYYNVNNTYISNWTNPAPNTITTSNRGSVSSARTEAQRVQSKNNTTTGARTVVSGNSTSRVNSNTGNGSVQSGRSAATTRESTVTGRARIEDNSTSRARSTEKVNSSVARQPVTSGTRSESTSSVGSSSRVTVPSGTSATSRTGSPASSTSRSAVDNSRGTTSRVSVPSSSARSSSTSAPNNRSTNTTSSQSRSTSRVRN